MRLCGFKNRRQKTTRHFEDLAKKLKPKIYFALALLQYEKVAGLGIQRLKLIKAYRF